MRTFFKYEYGYINLDPDNLSFTNTGNWSEVKGLQEKTTRSSVRSGFRRFRIGVFLIICILIYGSIFLFKLSSGTTSLIILAGIPYGAWQLYRYLRHDLGPAFRIPIQKILSFEREGDGFCLRFINGEDQPDQVFVQKVKGEDFQGILEKVLEGKRQTQENNGR